MSTINRVETVKVGDYIKKQIWQWSFDKCKCKLWYFVLPILAIFVCCWKGQNRCVNLWSSDRENNSWEKNCRLRIPLWGTKPAQFTVICAHKLFQQLGHSGWHSCISLTQNKKNQCRIDLWHKNDGSVISFLSTCIRNVDWDKKMFHGWFSFISLGSHLLARCQTKRTKQKISIETNNWKLEIRIKLWTHMEQGNFYNVWVKGILLHSFINHDHAFLACRVKYHITNQLRIPHNEPITIQFNRISERETVVQSRLTWKKHVTYFRHKMPRSERQKSFSHFFHWQKRDIITLKSDIYQ